MPAYRAFFLKDQHIERPGLNFEAADDVAALEHGRKFVNGHDVEVWENARQVGVLKREPSDQEDRENPHP